MSKSAEKAEKEKKPKEKFVVRTPTDIQRIKLQRLMENPSKEVIIPAPRVRKIDEFGNASIPSFVRNVMGSSAGAGSGEFHVYRHLRRKEYARQKNIQQKSKQEELDDEFRNRLEKNRMTSESKTAKKRAKRLKKKKNCKSRKLQPKTNEPADETSDESEVNDGSEDEESEKKTDEPSDITETESETTELNKQKEDADAPTETTLPEGDSVESTEEIASVPTKEESLAPSNRKQPTDHNNPVKDDKIDSA